MLQVRWDASVNVKDGPISPEVIEGERAAGILVTMAEGCDDAAAAGQELRVEAVTCGTRVEITKMVAVLMRRLQDEGLLLAAVAEFRAIGGDSGEIDYEIRGS